MKLISMIIPCYNEEDNIDTLMVELAKELPHDLYNFEYLMINDGSNDKTFDKLKTYQDNKQVKIINFSRNFGKETAMLAGLDYASGDATIIIDADLQMPLSYVSEMLLYWQEGYKLVLSHKEVRKQSLKGKMASKYYDVYNKISKHKINKDALDFQLMDREVVKVLTSIRERNRFLKGLTGYLGFKNISIPVQIEDRTQGVSKFSGFSTLSSYALDSFIIHSSYPLKLMLKIGLLISSLSFIYMIYIIVNSLVTGISASGYASLMSIMLFMFGVVILFLGIIGYYIGFMYEEIKQRPNYIVEDAINFDREDHH